MRSPNTACATPFGDKARTPRRPNRGPRSTGKDEHSSPEQVNLHEAELKKQGKTCEFHWYGGAGQDMSASIIEIARAEGTLSRRSVEEPNTGLIRPLTSHALRVRVLGDDPAL